MSNWMSARLFVVGLTACVSAACGASPDNGPMQSQGAKQNQIRLTPRDQVRDGGTFTWPIDNMPPNFNYHQIDGTEVAASDISKVLTPSAYAADAAGNPVWSRSLLASEPTVVLEPTQVVTFRINPKAAWYDGTPMTWEDFYWQWRANNGTDKRYQIASASGWEAVDSVGRGADDREVVVTFSPASTGIEQEVRMPVMPAMSAPMH